MTKPRTGPTRRENRLTNGKAAPKSKPADFTQPSNTLDLAALLELLGFGNGEHVSFGYADSGGKFHTAVMTPPDAPRWISRLPKQAHVYFGVNPVAGTARTNAGRGTSADVTRLTALYADLDVKAGGCPDLATAHAIVDELSTIVGTRPSAITRSGNGLHPYWPISDGQATTAEMMALMGRWGRLVAAVAQHHRAHVDSVFDLARVLRVPGTFNAKAPSNGNAVVTRTDSGGPLTWAEVDERLCEHGIYEEPDDSRSDEQVSNPQGWQFADQTCNYVRDIIDGLPGDGPPAVPRKGSGRHQWAASQCVRLACAWRLGCLSESDWRTAQTALHQRLHTLRAMTGERVPKYEVPDLFRLGIKRAAAKSDDQARAELREHEHAASDAGSGTTAKRSQASKLVDLALQRYKLGVSTDGKPFGYRESVPHIALDLRGGKLGLRQSLARDYFTKYGAAPTQSALADCCMVLEGIARTKPPTVLHLRVAGDAESVYIDTADEMDRAIEIRCGTWKLTENSPHMFSRTELIAPMEPPAVGGDLSNLWGHINIADEDRPLLLAIMVDALIQPNTPKPVTGFLAEHGTAKSTCAKRIVSMIDPSVVPLRGAPRDSGQWMSAAAGSWIVALDNLSTMPDWLSDAICRAATGDGDVKRQLYTDDSLSVVKFRRGVIVNGIDLGGLSGDITDRLVPIELQRIEDDARREEELLEQRWHAERADIFGGLLDLAAKVHKMLPTLTRKPLPRMADFARVLICVDAIMGTEGMQRYRARIEHMMADSAVSDSFIAQLVDMRYNTGESGQTAGEILMMVTPGSENLSWSRPADWPRRARAVTSRLHRHAPAVRSMGWHVSNDLGHNKQNTTRWFIRPPAHQ